MSEYYMGKPAFTRACLSGVRDIMAIMHVPLVESLCQTAMVWVPEHEFMLSSVRGLQRPCPIVMRTECYHFPRPQCQ
jgi:hypothetical protein